MNNLTGNTGEYYGALMDEGDEGKANRSKLKLEMP